LNPKLVSFGFQSLMWEIIPSVSSSKEKFIGLTEGWGVIS
jgi:hypothetical protein